MVHLVNCTYYEKGALQRRLCKNSNAFCCGPLSSRHCSSAACDYVDQGSVITPSVFWSILGVLSGIGALIIGITYLLCRFKKPTNQVADQDRGMLSDTFTQRTEIRTVLYSLNHAEYHCMQPTPLVQLQTRNETTTPPDTGPNATSSTATANTMSSLLQPQSSDRWSGYGSGDSVPTRDTVVTSVNATAVTPNTITTTDLKTENSRRNSSLKISLCRNSLFRKQDFEEVVV
ncbi:Hypothetical predicted protein [Octopus vulgaris]|uniref:Uncharacterized protein n=1 Tax=Octopus vulgaris TaxID=6645 RepID=A0AA36FIS4_OCTVU|nr:Hypothetical predicted protein [Octopus vulgaris]